MPDTFRLTLLRTAAAANEAVVGTVSALALLEYPPTSELPEASQSLLLSDELEREGVLLRLLDMFEEMGES